jgi:pilus assembly protein Flp/PilA
MLKRLCHGIKQFKKLEGLKMKYLKENGQGMVEYAFILILVAVIVIVVLRLLGPDIGDLFSQVVPNL